MISLQCESLASLMVFEASNTPHYCQALFLYNRTFGFCWAQLLTYVSYWVQPLFSCNHTAATPDAFVLRTIGFIRSESFSASSCSRYSLSSEYAHSCASFHCTCPFLRRLDSGAETSAKAWMWSLYSSPLILGRILLVLGGRLLTISLEFSSVLQMASVKTHIAHLVSQTLFSTHPLVQPVSASILWSNRSWTGISCHWVDRTGLQPSSWVLGLLR